MLRIRDSGRWIRRGTTGARLSGRRIPARSCKSAWAIALGRQDPAHQEHRRQRAGQLGQNEAGYIRRPDSSKTVGKRTRRPIASASVTTGFKWAPETGPNESISAMSAAPIAIELASSTGVTAREAPGHDAGANNRRNEKSSAYALSRPDPDGGHAHRLPILSSSPFSLRRSSLSSGRLRKKLVRVLNTL
jgi:hypothetical protein